MTEKQVKDFLSLNDKFNNRCDKLATDAIKEFNRKTQQ